MEAAAGLRVLTCPRYLPPQPWAVVATNEKVGTALETKYIVLREAWKGLDDAAISAARFATDAAEVTAALDAFVQALDAFEAKIPADLQ